MVTRLEIVVAELDGRAIVAFSATMTIQMIFAAMIIVPTQVFAVASLVQPASVQDRLTAEFMLLFGLIVVGVYALAFLYVDYVLCSEDRTTGGGDPS